MPSNFSQDLRDLVSLLLTRGQENAPSIWQILKKPIIYAELSLIIQDFLPLTEIDEISSLANSLISEIINIQCYVASTSDFGITNINEN